MGFSIGQLGPDAWTDPHSRSYRIHMEPDLTVKAACEDVGCDQQRFGWVTELDMSDPMAVLTANWFRSGQSGRTFRELTGKDAPVAVFRFDSGQRCFREHRTRPGFLRVYSGGRAVRAHDSLANLAEDYTEHMGGIADQFERG